MDEMKQRLPMLQEKAPSFKAFTTQGEINFPEDYRGKWVVFFSHPADFTPVCSTEFLMFGKRYNDFKQNNTELLGLSVDSTPSHIAWIKSLENINWSGIREMKIQFPIIEDITMEIAKKYGMIQEAASKTDAVRAVFIIDPEGIVRAIVYYPLTNGRNIDEILRLVKALQITDKEKVATPANWMPGDDVIIPNPKTVQGIDRRFDQQNDDYYCLDWYLCMKKHKMNEQMMEQLPSPRRMDHRPQTSEPQSFMPQTKPNQSMAPTPLQPSQPSNRAPMPTTPMTPNQPNATIPVQSDIVPTNLEPLRNPHVNIYDMAIRESETTPPQPNTQARSNSQAAAENMMNGMNTMNGMNATQFTPPPRIELPLNQTNMKTSSGRIIPSCPAAQPVFYPFPTEPQMLSAGIDDSHKIGIRF